MDKELVILLLKQSKEEPFINLMSLQEATTKSRAQNFFNELETLGFRFQTTIDNNFQITREQRAQIAIYAAKSGVDFQAIIKELSWQEFEILTAIIGDEFGYEADKGLNFSTSERKYQIDVVLRNRPYIFLIDCKHYGGTGKKSVLKKAVTDQIERIEAVQDNLKTLEQKLKIRKWKKVILMPMIITWLDEEIFFYEGVPVIPFPKLRSFFQNFYLFFEDIYQVTILE